jgi:hypothetical protein
MTQDQVQIGARIRLVRDIGGDCDPGAMLPLLKAGATGTVVPIDPYWADKLDGPAAYVRLDDHNPDLDDWANTIWVFTEYGEANLADFERI